LVELWMLPKPRWLDDVIRDGLGRAKACMHVSLSGIP
jgi:hypothetical protein